MRQVKFEKLNQTKPSQSMFLLFLLRLTSFLLHRDIYNCGGTQGDESFPFLFVPAESLSSCDIFGWDLRVRVEGTDGGTRVGKIETCPYRVIGGPVSFVFFFVFCFF